MANIGAALVGGGASILGGLIGAEESEDNRHFAEETGRRNEALQREFARNGIQWRVADAKDAGLHPLFALGGAGATYTPSAQTIGTDNHLGRGIAEAGQNVSRAMLASQTADQRALHAAQLAALEAQAQRDLAHSQYYLSLAARGPTNPPMANGEDVVTDAYGASVGPRTGSIDYRGTRIAASPIFADAIKLAPDDMVSRNSEHPERTAGRDHPSLREFNFGGGFKVLLPASSSGGVPEEIDATMLPVIIGANVRAYGARWLTDAMAFFTGRAPADERGGEFLEKIESMSRYFGRRTHDLVSPYSGRRQGRLMPPPD